MNTDIINMIINYEAKFKIDNYPCIFTNHIVYNCFTHKSVSFFFYINRIAFVCIPHTYGMTFDHFKRRTLVVAANEMY